MHTKYLFLRSESDDTNAADDSNISGNGSGIFSSGSNTQDEDESSDSSPECVDISLSDNDALLTDVSSTMISDVPGIDYIQKAKNLISDDRWEFAAIVDSAKTFVDEISLINATSHQTELRWSKKGKQPSWTLNYTILSFLLNGQNYVEYSIQYSRHDRATGYVTEQMEHNNFYHRTTGNHSVKTFHKDLMNLMQGSSKARIYHEA